MVVDEGHEDEDLRQRLAQARLESRGRRITKVEAQAATIAAYGLWRTLRRERRLRVETKERFHFTLRRRPASDATPQDEVSRLFEGNEEFLREPELPSSPPEPEPEAEAPDGTAPKTLPRSTKWWHEERARQAEAPFRAGGVKTVGLSFLPGQRPLPPPDHYLSWGPELKLGDLDSADRQAVLKILAKDLRAGGCEAVKWTDVDIVTPVRLVRHPVTGKPRLTHDSRAVNVRLADASASMAKAADALLTGGVAAKLDLLMAFRHIALEDRDQRVLGFTIDGVPFRWRALTFGCSQSPALFAAALANTIRSITLPSGATLVVYVDDVLVVATDAATLDAAMLAVCEGLTGGGWRLALDKVFPYAMGKAPFLGLVVDNVSGVLRVSRKKAERLEELCAAAIRNSRATLRDLQRIGGLLAFMHCAAPEAGLCRHGINAATAEAERLPGRTVCIKGQLASDLSFWRKVATTLPDMTQPAANGESCDVATDASGLPTLGYGGIVWPASSPAPDIEEALGKADEFASHPRSGTVISGGEVYAGPLPIAIASYSSSALEVRALRVVLAKHVARHGPDTLRGRTVRWLCDSSVAVGTVGRWRAKAEELAAETIRLLAEVRKYGCRLRPEWVSREAGWQPVADALSKVQWVRDSPEWGVCRADVEQICREATGNDTWSPALDLFAAPGNATAPAFVSQWPTYGNAWTDAFARSWAGLGRLWAFPPFGVAKAALRHACRGSPMDLLIIVPRCTAVPARLEAARRLQLPPLRLRDASGHRPPQPCPVDLDAIYIVRP